MRQHDSSRVKQPGRVRFLSINRFSAHIIAALLALFCMGSVSELDTQADASERRWTQGNESIQSVPDLSGTWAQQQVTTSVTRVPVVGRVTSRTETTLRLTIRQQGTELEIDTEVCSIDIRNRPNLVRTIIPDAFISSLPRTTRSARLRPTSSGFTLDQPRFVEIIGARLSDPNRDELPETSDDPRVFDQDGTGSPGVTVRIGGIVNGDVYVVQRAWNRLRSDNVTRERFDGTIDWNNEQVVIGSSNAFISRDAPASPELGDERNYFRTTRVEDGTSCHSLRANERQLFSR